MEDRLDAHVLAAFDAGEEILVILVVGDGGIRQIAELGSIGEIVDDHDVGAPALVQRGDDIAADHSGPARHDDHVGLPFAVPL